jgi:hypothetical protein
VFGVTNYWDADVQANPAIEEQQAIAASDAAAESKVKHLIWRSEALSVSSCRRINLIYLL